MSHERVVLRKREGLPHGDIIIFPMHTPNEPLDGVPTVVQDEDDRGQLVGDHSGQLLDSELPERKSRCVI